eukprot:1158150-Pelagomonas_calceolata.AAC.6
MGTLKTIAPSPGLDAPSVFSLLPAEEAIGGRKENIAAYGEQQLFPETLFFCHGKLDRKGKERGYIAVPAYEGSLAEA